LRLRLADRLTLITPVHNDVDGLCRMLDSIARLTDPPTVVVVDDGSSDVAATKRAVSEARLASTCVVSERNVGPAGARNLGAKRCETAYLAFLDADDELLPGWDRWASQVAEREDALAFCSALFVRLESGTQRVSLPEEKPLMDGGPVHFLAGTFIVSAEAFRSVGGYEEALWQGENHELGIRLCAVIPSTQRSMTRQALVQVHPSPERIRARAAHRLTATEYMLDRHRSRLSRHPSVEMTYRNMAAVNAQRAGQLKRARTHLRAAAALGDRASWLRLLFTYSGPIARRYYARR
jgi:glycosyltransferase involved in cell wall biosynthesis